jgi:mono/diheme cytochrome c family protein
MSGLDAATGAATPKSHGGKCKTMKIKSLVLVACLALTSSAFAAADGAAVFKAKCAMCHGADGSASTGMGKTMGLKPLSSPEVQKMSDADLTALVTNGKGKMPAYKGKLTDDEIGAVVKYVKTLK